MSEKLTAKELRERIRKAERLIKGLDRSTVAGLRNRALVGLVAYGAVSLDAALRMRVGDYERLGNGGWVRVVVDGKTWQVLLPRTINSYLEQYVTAAGIRNAPAKSYLFRAMWP